MPNSSQKPDPQILKLNPPMFGLDLSPDQWPVRLSMMKLWNSPWEMPPSGLHQSVFLCSNASPKVYCLVEEFFPQTGTRRWSLGPRPVTVCQIHLKLMSKVVENWQNMWWKTLCCLLLCFLSRIFTQICLKFYIFCRTKLETWCKSGMVFQLHDFWHHPVLEMCCQKLCSSLTTILIFVRALILD